MTGKKVKKNGDGDDDEEKPADGGDGEKKNKQPNLTRLLKARLQKLVDKTDEETCVHPPSRIQLFDIFKSQASCAFQRFHGDAVEEGLPDVLQANQASNMHRNHFRKWDTPCLWSIR